MVSSIANSLGFGSGLDVKQIVTDLSNASREPKIARVTELTQTNQTRISALAQARADLDGFADSLSQMVNDGTLRSTPTVSDESVLGAISRAGLSADSFARSEEHTSELQSLMRNSYAVSCLKKKINKKT